MLMLRVKVTTSSEKLRLLVKFNSIKDAKKLLEAVEKRFGGNAATKKTQRNLLKQQYENFTAPSSEMFNQTFDRFQKVVSQLELLEEKLSQEDVNKKLLRSFSPDWNIHVVVWRNKADLDTMSIYDIYNNLKVYEQEVKGMKLTINGNEAIGLDKSNVERYNCHKREHFFRECKAPRNRDNKNKESSRRSVHVETSTSTALVSCDGLGGYGYDWSDQVEKGPNYALMAFSSSSSKSEVSNDSTCSKSCLETVKLLKSQNDQLLKDLKKSELMVLVPPPYTGNFMPPTPDSYFTSLDEFVNKPLLENYKAKSSEEETKKMYYLVVTDDYSRFTWVFFLATKDETSGILKLFINGIENLVYHKVKVIRCDNGIEFKNREMNQFCEMKGKFDGKTDEGFFVGYSLNSKAFRVFNSRTRIVEENLHIRFSESTPNILSSRPDWLFDIDELIRTMIYEPIVAGTQSNGFADPPFSKDAKSSHDDGSKPSSDDGKKVDEDLTKENKCNDQEKEDNVNNTNNVNTVSSTINVAGSNKDNELPFDPNMPALEDVSTFYFSRNDEDDGAVADMNNLDTTIQVSPIPTTRIHKDHPLDQVIGDLQSAIQTRKMSKNLEEHGFTLVDLPNEKRAIGTKWVFMNKKDERGIVIRNKARLVAQGYAQEEGIDYDEVFDPVVRIKAIRLFLAYASFKDFVVYQMDVKSAFLYGKIEEEVYVCQPPVFEDPDFHDRVYDDYFASSF
uniref:Integrase catalytic domain-containing protein n=1 Tax=Tanacetum cinerariifolium TaxID=118510 RepID=A0A6L2LC35_TANCI|nr:hypothetical protein [Tanacetum cinerariifolium]